MIEKDVKSMYVQSEIKVKKDHKSFPSPKNKTENAIVNECNKLIKLLIFCIFYYYYYYFRYFQDMLLKQ